MTLVVGLRQADRVWLLSDSRISHPDVTQVEEIPGRLKLVLLRDICVAYAGAADHSLDIIRRAPANASFDKTLEFFRAAHVDSGQSVDFMVSSASTKALIRISEGGIVPVHGEAWIGDADAFDKYSSRKNSTNLPVGIPSDLEKIARATQAFMDIVQDHSVPTVSGLTFRVGSRPEGFMYASQASAYYPSQEIPSGVSTPLKFGSAVDGGFAYTLLVPRDPGVPLIAAHFYQGALGFIYAPLVTDKPTQVSNVSHEQLKAMVLERYGVVVDGAKFG